ncbi:twin-arg-translocated uncharacterized repeat protein [Hartmannibacter diazotrophicus]|uniref:Twin-arg-translocated uncharacterized repeat protein n=1 Tax=Hartmannibacter diazotrophicus TaxID=1482074 RepID=A0A2C9D3U1_9HYPH|nr:TIGR03808 family TAT-translocated repetitive protein [Hartmannibacter diazotrophicus]SON54828.1 twin-arg-translocated uncharacterized repeat protein [Hartmannibacter diazotrophicus]
MDRRAFLYGTAASIGTGLILTPAHSERSGDGAAVLRGSFTRPEASVQLDEAASENQSRVMQEALDRAGEQGKPLFLPAGRYEVSNIRVPAGVRIIGVAGQSRLVYSGGGKLLYAEDSSSIGLEGIVMDGANRALDDPEGGLLSFRTVADFSMERCSVVGSAGHALALTRVSGRIVGNSLSGAIGSAITSEESAGLSISGNEIGGCGKAGIVIRRWTAADDGTTITNNRIADIATLRGDDQGAGTGILIVQAGGVLVSGNRIADCAENAVKAVASPNVQVVGNSVMRAGRTAILVSDGCDGALISSNIVDGAATGLHLAGPGGPGSSHVCQGNVIRNISGGAEDDRLAGVGLVAETSATITGNVVENAAGIALIAGTDQSADEIVATGNVLRGGRIGIGVSVADTAGHTLLSANMISNTTDGAIRGMLEGEVVTEDLSVASAVRFSNLTIGENRIS